MEGNTHINFTKRILIRGSYKVIVAMLVLLQLSCQSSENKETTERIDSIKHHNDSITHYNDSLSKLPRELGIDELLDSLFLPDKKYAKSHPNESIDPEANLMSPFGGYGFNIQPIALNIGNNQQRTAFLEVIESVSEGAGEGFYKAFGNGKLIDVNLLSDEFSEEGAFLFMLFVTDSSKFQELKQKTIIMYNAPHKTTTYGYEWEWKTDYYQRVIVAKHGNKAFFCWFNNAPKLRALNMPILKDIFERVLSTPVKSSIDNGLRRSMRQ